ncbi:ABC transporter permease [Streptosporangium roseum]|uniref:Oligopeptide ABC transporter, permease protein n=1 Tax=Streptosporangium roseum (strain ATCC 12428 / DSM 43021 / JCM 3005 / KCTC 9067 / NCIMB 10171 / NRRL 2505 / NI 9100) TaxID=479432 RepID=D2AUS8_STRRD|nr:ABC transporter permease [Streptosporangium roseum]ACZ84940.1 oligopeptide ABC transporter, permease protein [Streptosporangium roseum DSM 43021]
MRSKVVLARLARNAQARYGLFALLLLLLLAYVGPFAGAHDWTDKDFLAFLEPPSAEHWWGTTQIGQDVYAVTLRGMQKSIIIGFLVALFSTGVAALVGAAAGYFGGWVDRALMWGADLLLVLPSFLIIAILSPNLKGGSWLWFVVLLAAFSWMITSRVVRSMTLSLREREYILAARYMGIPGWRIILRHVVPNLSSLLIIDATLNVSAAIIGEASLSFFGFGVQPPDVSLGTLIAAGSGQVTGYPWLFLFPAGLLVLLVLSVNLVGDGLRDALDPGSNQ